MPDKKIRILITGFESNTKFSGNLSGEVVTQLAAQRAEIEKQYGGNVEILTHIFPIDEVNPGAAIAKVLKAIQPPPDFIVGTGMSLGRTETPIITSARFAQNTFEDSDGKKHIIDSEKSSKEKLAGFDTGKLNLGIPKLVPYNERRSFLVNMNSSEGAGSYLCNVAFYEMLKTTSNSTFLHFSRQGQKDADNDVVRDGYVKAYTETLKQDTIPKIVDAIQQQQKLQALVPQGLLDEMKKGMENGSATYALPNDTSRQRG